MPPKHEIIWTSVAHADLLEIIQYIRADNPSAATDNLKKIKDRGFSELKLFPQQERIVPELKQQGILHYRELIIPPWRVIYRFTEHQVYVLPGAISKTYYLIV